MAFSLLRVMQDLYHQPYVANMEAGGLWRALDRPEPRNFRGLGGFRV